MNRSLLSTIEANLNQVRLAMQAACKRSGRTEDEVRLVAVTKYAPTEALEALAQLGFQTFGESRPQQLMERAGQLPEGEFHLIGHLQRNKVRPVLPVAHTIHSVDSLRLLKRIDTVAAELSLRPRVLLEVNVAGEASKDGFSPTELRDAWGEAHSCEHVDIAGLMTMAPHTDEERPIRETFQGLKSLRDELASQRFPLPELSMGMSGDFEIAIEEGATLIRVGSKLFAGIDG